MDHKSHIGFAIKNMRFGVVNEVDQYDGGAIGLSPFSSSIVHQLSNLGALNKPMFSIYLNKCNKGLSSYIELLKTSMFRGMPGRRPDHVR